MANFLKNWKTSAAGVLTIALGAGALFGIKVGAAPIDPTTAFGMITVGFGLLFGKDGNVSGV